MQPRHQDYNVDPNEFDESDIPLSPKRKHNAISNRAQNIYRSPSNVSAALKQWGSVTIYLFISIIPIVTSILLVLSTQYHECKGVNATESSILFIITSIIFISTCCLLCAVNNNDIDINISILLITLSVLFIAFFTQYILVVHIYTTITTSSHQISCTTDINMTLPRVVEYLLLSWIIIYPVAFMIISIVISIKQGSIKVFAASFLCIVMIPVIMQLLLMLSGQCEPMKGLYVGESIANVVVTLLFIVVGVMLLSQEAIYWVIPTFLFWLIHCIIITHTCYVYWSNEVKCAELDEMRIATVVLFVILVIVYMMTATCGGGCMVMST